MDLTLSSDLDTKDYQSIFFDRPVSSLRKRNIAVLVGSNTNLYEVQQAYMVIRAMNHNAVLVVDDRLREVGLPADIYLSTHRKLLYENSDEAIARINDCHLLVAGVGIEMNASMQLLLERVLREYRGVAILTESAFKLPNINELLNERILLFGKTKKLLTFNHRQIKNINSRGLLRKIDLLNNTARSSGGGVICTENHQIISVEPSEYKVSVINNMQGIDSVAFLAILVSLIADRDTPLDSGWSRYSLAAGFLYENYYQKEKNPRLLEDFLHSQF